MIDDYVTSHQKRKSDFSLKKKVGNGDQTDQSDHVTNSNIFFLARKKSSLEQRPGKKPKAILFGEGS